MRTTFAMGLAIVGGVGGGMIYNSFHTATHSARTPSLAVDPVVVDFGRIPAGVTATRTVTLTNRTTANVRITNVHQSCGCTSAELQSKELAAHQSTSLRITLTGKQGFTTRTATVAIKTNQPSDPVYTVKTVFESGGADVVLPQSVHFGLVTKDDLPFHRTVDVFTRRPSEADAEQLIRATASRPFLACERADEQPNENRIRFRVTLLPDAPTGDLSASIRFSGPTLEQDLAINAHGSLRGNVFAKPRSLVLRVSETIRSEHSISVECQPPSDKCRIAVKAARVLGGLQGRVDVNIADDRSLTISTRDGSVPKNKTTEQRFRGAVVLEVETPTGVQQVNVPVILTAEGDA